MRTNRLWRSVAAGGLALVGLGLWVALMAGPARAQAPVIKSFSEIITLKPDGDAEFLEAWQVPLAPGVTTTLSRPLPISDTAAVDQLSVVTTKLVESSVVNDHGRVVLRWSAAPDPQKPDTFFLVSYTVHGAVQAIGQNDRFTWVALPADFPYPVTSTVVTVEPPYSFPESDLQFSLTVGGGAIPNGCYALPGTRTIHGQGACYINNLEVAYTAGAFTGQPWQVSVRYPRAAPLPTPTLFVPTATPMLQVSSAETPLPFLASALALVVSAGVVGLLWAWARPTPAQPLHEVISVGIVLIGATLAAGSLGLIWLRPGSFYWMLSWAFGGALLIVGLILLPWAVFQGRAYDRDRQQMLAGQNLAHWQVTAEEHRQFVASEIDRLRHSLWLFVIGTAVVTVLGGLLGSRAHVGVMLGAILLAAGLLATASYAVAYFRLQVRYASGQDLGPGEIYVSAKGALLFGRYVPLQGFNLWVEAVSVPQEEPVRLQFRTVSASRRGRIINDIFVPVPPDRRAEAEALAAAYPVTTT